MIYVDRSSVPVPEFLLSPQVDQERQRIAEFLKMQREHREQMRFKFRSDIYIKAKSSLLDLFQNKCAYCEARLLGPISADVEHFRPKTRAENLDGRVDESYYTWLAYEWDNLLIACAECNRQHRVDGHIIGKLNRFPVAGPRAPFLTGVDECRKVEQALLLDPCFDRPEDHLDFNQDGFCVALSERGDVTIEVIGLNRPALVEERRGAWKKSLQAFQHLIQATGLSLPQRVERFAAMKAPESRYTATVRSALRHAVNDLSEASNLDLSTAKSDEEILEAFLRHSGLLEPENIKGAVPKPSLRSRGVPPTPGHLGRSDLPPHSNDRIRAVTIKNFKAIEFLKIDFRTHMPDNHEQSGALMLLGENATAKSTILEAIAMTLVGTEQLQRLELEPGDFIRRSKGWEAPIEEENPAHVTVIFDNGEQLELHIDPGDLRFEGQLHPATVLLAYGPRRFFPSRRRLRRSADAGERLRTLFDPLALVPNPRSWLMHCSKGRFNAVVRALREVLLLPDEALVVRPRRGQRRGKQIMFEIQDESSPLDRLSDGYKTIVATSVDIMREMLEYWPDLESAGGVVLIDELEAHLHPRWKMRIARSLRNAMPNVQFLMTSHDPVCLRGMQDGEVQVMYRETDRGINRMTDLPNVQGLSVEQLLTSDFFGLHSAEDPNLEIGVARYAELAANLNRTPDEETELDGFRKKLQKHLALGKAPENQVLFDAMNEYTQSRIEARKSDRPNLKKEAVSTILDIWQSLPVEGEGQ